MRASKRRPGLTRLHAIRNSWRIPVITSRSIPIMESCMFGMSRPACFACWMRRTAYSLPLRGRDRLEFMRTYGVLTAYLHDIGMVDFSSAGRAMHPEFATQEVFTDPFNSLLDAIWIEDLGDRRAARGARGKPGAHRRSDASSSRDALDGELPQQVEGAGRNRE